MTDTLHDESIGFSVKNTTDSLVSGYNMITTLPDTTELDEPIETSYLSYFQVSTICLACYYIIGILFFWMFEHSGFVKGVYWTLTLNGQTNQVAKVFEDDEFTPKTNIGKLFSVFWISTGFLVVGYFLANVISYLIEKQELLVRSKIGKSDDRKVKRRDLLIYILFVMGFLLAACIAVATMVYGMIEDWKLVDAFYFAVCTSMAVGESDFSPKSGISQAFGTVMVIITGLIFTTTLTVLLEYISERAKQRIVDKAFNKKLSLATLTMMDENQDGMCTREEFLKFMLIEAQLVDQEKIEEIVDKFNELDVTKDGSLNLNDIQQIPFV